MTGNTIALTTDGGVAVLTLNRPEAGNTVNMALALDLEQAVDAVLADPTVRVIAVTGAGKLFCGGGDIGAFASAPDAGAFLFDLASALHRSVLKLANGPKPVVTIVNGPAAGAGLSLAISGDVVVAARSSHFTAAYGGVGLTPDGGMSWLLPRLVGMRRAQDIILTNRRIGSEEAAAIGLVSKVVENEDLLAEGLAAARALAAGPVAATGGARALLAQSLQNDLSTQLDLEATRIGQAAASAEASEGIAAFLERRKPDFPGVTNA